MVYTPPPPPPDHLCLSVTFYTPVVTIINLACINLAWLHLFGEARGVQLRHAKGASKMNRLLFTLTVVVLMAAHSVYCTTFEFER